MLKQCPKIPNRTHRIAEQRRNEIKISERISIGMLQIVSS
jgi:hypothetical protein